MAWGTPIAGTVVKTNASSAVNPNASHASGDLEFLFISSQGVGGVGLATANGFAAVTGLTNLDTGGTNANGRVVLDVYWRRWNGSDGSPTMNAPGNNLVAVIISVSGGIASGDPWDVTGSTNDTSSDTSVSCTDVTTTQADDLVFAVVAQGLPDSTASNAEFSSWTNANLASLTELTDESTAIGGGSALGVAYGTKASAGATGATTATAATTSFRYTAQIALKIASGHTVAIGTATETDSAIAITASKSRAIGIALETDEALAITLGGGGPWTVAIGTATETDTPIAITASKSRAVGIATETDLAITITPSKKRAVGLATEADSAIAVTASKRRGVGTATETDSAITITASKKRAIGIATETDIAIEIIGYTNGPNEGRIVWIELRVPEAGDLFPEPSEGPVDRGHDRDVHFW